MDNVTGNITLREGETIDIVCNVGPCAPTPYIKIAVGDTSMKWRDITKDFERTPKINFYCQDTQGTSKTCPLNMDYSVTLTGKYVPHYSDNYRFLKCEATYPDIYMLPAVSSKVQVFYECKPPKLDITSVSIDYFLPRSPQIRLQLHCDREEDRHESCHHMHWVC